MIKLAYINYSEPLIIPFDSVEYIDSMDDDMITVNFRESRSSLNLPSKKDNDVGRELLVAYGEYQEAMSKAVSE
jgi:hypothetical protein